MIWLVDKDLAWKLFKENTGLDAVFNEGSEGDAEADNDSGEKHTTEVESLKDILNDLTLGGRKSLTPEDTEAAKELAGELGLGVDDHRGDAGRDPRTGENHWTGGDHIHIENIRLKKGNHIPAKLPDSSQ